ncbi:conserved protein of unknown function [Ralstonia solanacearum CMR15]|nr:conserved protein of unknown function [Ralstonia solanacearum CMR15]
MDANKPADPSHEVSAIDMLQGRNEMLEESIRRAQETLSAVSAQVTRQLPLLNQNVERFVETEGMPFHEAQTLAKRHMRGEAVSSANVARAFAALLEQVEALEADQAARRRVQQQWMVSQLTYKMLYLHHTTRNPALSAPALRAQKGRVRARVLALLDAGRSYDDIRMADLRFEDDAGEA